MNNRIFRSSVVAVIMSLLFATIFFSCNNSSKKVDYIDHRGEIFTTYFHFNYEYERPILKEILDRLRQFEESLNPFMDSSIVSKVNRNEPTPLDIDFVTVFNKAKEVSIDTDGMFDMTASPLINAWGFGFDKSVEPTQDVIDSLKEFVGYDKIDIIDGKIVKEDLRVHINPSAISKGYSCDIVAQLFDSLQIKNYLVEIGGEIVAKGESNKGRPWRIGINKVDDDSLSINSELQSIIEISGFSVATSGNYRKFYIKDGKRYAHTINPVTGYPCQQEILSATVISDNCMTADAYATAFMVLGLEKSIAVAKRHPYIKYYFIYAKEDGSHGIEYSEGFENLFVK